MGPEVEVEPGGLLEVVYCRDLPWVACYGGLWEPAVEPTAESAVKPAVELLLGLV